MSEPDRMPEFGDLHGVRISVEEAAHLPPGAREEFTVTMPDGTRVRPYRFADDGETARVDDDGELVI